MRVYTHDADGLDLLVIGRVDMGLRANSSSSSSSNGKAGKIVREEFIARFVVVDDGSLENGEGPRLKYSRVWSVSYSVRSVLPREFLWRSSLLRSPGCLGIIRFGLWVPFEDKQQRGQWCGEVPTVATAVGPRIPQRRS